MPHLSLYCTQVTTWLGVVRRDVNIMLLHAHTCATWAWVFCPAATHKKCNVSTNLSASLNPSITYKVLPAFSVTGEPNSSASRWPEVTERKWRNGFWDEITLLTNTQLVGSHMKAQSVWGREGKAILNSEACRRIDWADTLCLHSSSMGTQLVSFKRHVKIHLVETGKGRGSEELWGQDWEGWVSWGNHIHSRIPSSCSLEFKWNKMVLQTRS